LRNTLRKPNDSVQVGTPEAEYTNAVSSGGRIVQLDYKNKETASYQASAGLLACATVDLDGDGKQEIACADYEGYVHLLSIDLKGFGRDGRVFFWLRQGDADAKAAHIGFVAKSEAKVNAFYEAAMAAGATDNGKPGARLYYDPRYYAANVFDPDGYSLEAVYKSWQHRQS